MFRHGAAPWGHGDAHEKENKMQITKNSIKTNAGPREWFTGAVYVDTVAVPSGPSRLAASSVHFTPGARTAWHSHPNGQTIYVTEGAGLCQRRGGPIEVILPGDRVFFEPGEDGASAAWGDHVTDEEYAAAAAAER